MSPGRLPAGSQYHLTPLAVGTGKLSRRGNTGKPGRMPVVPHCITTVTAINNDRLVNYNPITKRCLFDAASEAAVTGREYHSMGFEYSHTKAAAAFCGTFARGQVDGLCSLV